MIDGETSELHDTLSHGQRQQDIDVMVENLAGEMSDIAAMNEVPIHQADLELGQDIASRYENLWAELTDDLVISKDEAYLIRDRIARINDLGFSVEDFEIVPTEMGDRVVMRTMVGGRTHNSDRLRAMTGIEAPENQARLLLGDLNYHLAKYGHVTATGKHVGTFRWLAESFEPITARIEKDWHGEDPIQGYCDFLQHRMELAMKRETDVSNEETYKSWVASGFPGFPLD